MRFLLKEFYVLKKALLLWKKNQTETNKRKIHIAAQELRRMFTGLFFGEFRTEYRLYRNFTKLQKELRTILAAVEDKAARGRIVSLLEKAAVYNAKLAELGSRGGVLEKIILRLCDEEDTLADQRELEHKINEAIQASNAFEIVMQALIKETQAIPSVKKSIALVPRLISEKNNIFFYKDMGVHVHQGAFILYDAVRFREIMGHGRELATELEQDAFENGGKFTAPAEQLEMYRFFVAFQQGIKEKEYPSSSGLFGQESRLTYDEFIAFRMCIIGYCEFKLHQDRTDFLGAYEIWRIAARKGFGTFFLELFLSYASLDHRPVIIDRSEVSSEARLFWYHFDVKRRDVLKYPAALLKYPEEIGWTKKDVVSTFGGSIGSTFTGSGKPRKSFYDGKWRYGDYSYLNKESKPETNLVLDPLASLDKAFFYDGKVKDLKILMSRSETVLSSLDDLPEMKALYAKYPILKANPKFAETGKSVLFHAGYAFFQSFIDTASDSRLKKHQRQLKRKTKR